jgi:hypothetical protein
MYKEQKMGSIMRILFAFLLSVAVHSQAFAMNDICQGEFVPLMQSHSAVMQQAEKLPKGQPKTFEQAVANSNAHCSFLTKAGASFTRIQAWMKKNQDFCQVPDSEIKTVATSTETIGKNRAAACNAVNELKKKKSQAEKQQAMSQQQQQQQQNPFSRAGGTGRANDPFNPQIVRKPQLSTE